MTKPPVAEDIALQSGVEVWRGGVNTWECDEMGHMNVRFYVARAIEGLAGLAGELGMVHAFSPRAGSTLQVREQHIRFLREIRPPAALHMIAGVVEMGETEARLLLTLVHSITGAPAASFQTVVSHVTAGEGRPFPWPKAVLERAARLTTPVPAYAAARSLDLAPVATTASLARADAAGLTTIAAGALGPRDTDVFGRMTPETFIGRIADGVGRMILELHDIVLRHAPAPSPKIGAAALEYRLIYLTWPRTGDRFVIRSALASVDQRALRMAHWMLDPETGAPWAVAEAITATLDLDARKIVPISAPAQAALGRMITPDMAL